MIEKHLPVMNRMDGDREVRPPPAAINTSGKAFEPPINTDEHRSKHN
jgi:hypothetical protein